MDVFFVESRLAGAGGGRAVRFGVATQRFLGAAGAASGVGQFTAPERLWRCARRIVGRRTWRLCFGERWLSGGLSDGSRGSSTVSG